MFDSTLLVPFLRDLVEYVNIYCALLLVEFTMSTAELISVVKLRVFVNFVFWCFGFVLGEKVEKEKKMKAMSCHAGRQVKLIY